MSLLHRLSEYNAPSMKAKIYEKFGRIVYRLVTPTLRLLPASYKLRVRTVVVNDNNELLLVRSWMGSQSWNLPGGGIGYQEDSKSAAVREIREETGIITSIPELKDLGVIKHPDPKSQMQLQGYATRANGNLKPRSFGQRLEILASAWWPLDNLPKERSQLVDEFLRRAGYL